MNTLNKIIAALIASLLLAACTPSDDYELGGELQQMPATWNISATETDNEVVIKFDPLSFIGSNITAVEFRCVEAGINILMKDASRTEIRQKVYRSGNYTLNVTPISRAGTGTSKEVTFSVVKNLLLETLGRSTFKEETQLSGETFLRTEMYIEQNSTITLTDEIATDDVVINLDYFERESTSQAKFVAESGVYTLLYSTERKIVLVQVAAPDYPAFLIAIGKGFAYPAKQNPAFAAGYPQEGTAADVLTYMLYRRVAANTYQVTAMLKGGDSNLEFKAYHAHGAGRLTSNWGNGGEYKHADCAFSGVRDVFAPAADGNNWVAGPALSEASLYRVTVTITEEKAKANVRVDIVDWNGKVQPYEEPEPEEPADPDLPIVSNTIDPTKGKVRELDGETVTDIFHTLAQDSVYATRGAMINALFNPDFFEKTDGGKVKFLGVSGDYHLVFNPARNNVIIEAIEPASPDFMFLCGVGLGYPTRTPQSVIEKIYPGKQIVTFDNWNFDNTYKYILMRRIADNVYQATAMLPSLTPYWWAEGPYAAFKIYRQPINDAAHEIRGSVFLDGGGIVGTATDAVTEFNVRQTDGNISIFNPIAVKAVRITVDLNTNTLTVDNYALP